jgi:hypothetical protein
MKKIILIISLFMPVMLFGQIRSLTATGMSLALTSSASITNSTSDLTLVQDSVKANTMSTYKKVTFNIKLAVTTGLLAPGVNVKVSFGGTSVTLLSSSPLSISLSSQPITITGYIKNKGATNSQILWLEVRQGPTLVLGIGGNSGLYTSTLTKDTTVSNLLSVTANFTSAQSGSTMSIVDSELTREL